MVAHSPVPVMNIILTKKHSKDKHFSLFYHIGRYEEENVLTTLSPVRVRAKSPFLSQTSDQVSIL